MENRVKEIGEKVMCAVVSSAGRHKYHHHHHHHHKKYIPLAKRIERGERRERCKLEF